mgnify:CR=1 FL=1
MQGARTDQSDRPVLAGGVAGPPDVGLVPRSGVRERSLSPPILEKGKPVVRLGRKAKDRVQVIGHGSLAAEGKIAIANVSESRCPGREDERGKGLTAYPM